jgi:hypothetical protein
MYNPEDIRNIGLLQLLGGQPDFGAMEQLLGLDKKQRFAAHVGPELRRWHPATVEAERLAGAGLSARGGARYQPPKVIEDALTNYSRGTMKSDDVQKVFKEHGWSVDLRRGRYDFEAFDPSGKAHYIAP